TPTRGEQRVPAAQPVFRQALLSGVASSRQLMRVTLIANPFASAVSEDCVRAVGRALGGVAETPTLLPERAGHATELAAAAEGDALVVLSGDGGFNEVLNGAPAGVPVGVLAGR